MAPADKAVLRLGIGLGLAVLIAYGLALTAPHLICMLTVVILRNPGPAIPFVKGAVLAAVVAAVLAAGVLMVPLLENYRVAGLLITGSLLYAVFFAGARSGNPSMIIFAIALTLIPVEGVAEQAKATTICQSFGVGLAVGVTVSGFSHALFPDPPGAYPALSARDAVSREAASWSALQAILLIMPVFVVALTNPSLYTALIMKTVIVAQQAGLTGVRSKSREIVGSTFIGALLSMVVWAGLSVRPNLWMLMLWIVAAALWAGTRMFGVKHTSVTPWFWSNTLMTMLILLGPAIEDSANSNDVYKASAIRLSLFVAVSLYASATVWLFERWRASRSRSLLAKSG